MNIPALKTLLVSASLLWIGIAGAHANQGKGTIASSVETVPNRIVTGHLYYVALTSGLDAAMTQADVYRQRDIGEDSAELNAFTSELLLASGWLDTDDESQGGSQSIDTRLRYLFALKHYRLGEFVKFAQAMTALASAGWEPSTAQSRYLAGEYYRLAGDLERAVRLTASIRRHQLVDYLRFNIAVDALAAENIQLAKSSLKAIVKGRATSQAQFELQSRATMVLALLQQREGGQSESLLLSLDTDSRYGPGALALLGEQRLQREDYQRAAGYLSRLLDQYPQSREALTAHYGFAYAIEKSGDWRSGLAGYVDAEQHLLTRLGAYASLLAAVQGDIRQVVLSARNSDRANAPIVDLWQNQEAVRVRMERLSWLFHRADKLEADLQRLSALQQVAVEQVRRSRLYGESLLQQQFAERARHAQDQQNQLITFYRGNKLWRINDPELASVLTADEQSLLKAIDRSYLSAQHFNADAETYSRIRRLRGAIQFATYQDLPVRARERVRQLLSLPTVDIEKRVARISAMGEHLNSMEGVPARLLVAEAQLAELKPMVADHIAQLNDSLVADLRTHVHQQVSAVEGQLALTRLAMARIADDQLLAEARP